MIETLLAVEALIAVALLSAIRTDLRHYGTAHVFW